MKVINSINKTYQQQLESNNVLKKKVDEIVKTNKKEMWHYFSRVKSEESYALKIETGRIENLSNMEDFFACTIVVENSIEINKAVELIKRFFEIIQRRPKTDDYTFKSPESFPYDDLRLYVKLKSDESLPPESIFNKLSDLTFEIQIKTFLQHAWWIATHDLIYKGEEINWAKQRIAYQIKAMLEHAEISIHEIEKIKESDILAKMNKKIKQMNHIKEFLIKNWSEDKLPHDIIRISQNTFILLEQLKITTSELQICLDKEASSGRGTKTTDLSPYFIIIQTVINQAPQKIIEFMSSSEDNGKIVIPAEINSNSLTLNKNRIISF